MKKILAGIFLLVSIVAFAEKDITQDSFRKITEKGIAFAWKIEGKNLKVKLETKTTGWIGVGFNPTKIMKGANIIIGYVKEGRAVIRDDFGSKEKGHSADVDLGGKDNITEKKGTEVDGTTSLEFSIPLDSGDEYDAKLIPGKEYKLMLAMGEEDSFTKKHKVKTKITFTL